MNWRDISYLATGNKRQKAAFRTLSTSRILEILDDFDPVLVSTISIDIDVPESDLDIICEVRELDIFKEVLERNFEHFDKFSLTQDAASVVCKFNLDGFEIEIYGTEQPVESQHAFRHLNVVWNLISHLGEKFRRDLRDQKLLGTKTEPAVAKLLGLKGDPYKAVLEFESEENLKQLKY